LRSAAEIERELDHLASSMPVVTEILQPAHVFRRRLPGLELFFEILAEPAFPEAEGT
jgi:hypothetical protein